MNVSRRTTKYLVDLLLEYKDRPKEELEKAVQLLYNAGYRRGLKARNQTNHRSRLVGYPKEE